MLTRDMRKRSSSVKRDLVSTKHSEGRAEQQKRNLRGSGRQRGLGFRVWFRVWALGFRLYALGWTAEGKRFLKTLVETLVSPCANFASVQSGNS